MVKHSVEVRSTGENPKDSVMSLQSSFRNQPLGNRVFAVLLGVLTPVFFFALGPYLAITGTASIFDRTIGLVFTVVVGFIFIGVTWPDFLLTKGIVLYTDRITYRGFWSSTKIRYGNVSHAMSAMDGSKHAILIFSRSRSVIGMGDGFGNEDKGKVWSYLRSTLDSSDVKFHELMSKAEAIERAIEIDKEVRSIPLREVKEETTHNITKALLVFGFGFILIFGLFMFYTLVVSVIEIDFGLWTVITAVLIISMLMAVGSFVLGKWRVFGWGIYGMALTLFLLGFQMIVDQQAWLFGLFASLLAIIIVVLGRTTLKQHTDS
jgi:hypothetical protein